MATKRQKKNALGAGIKIAQGQGKSSAEIASTIKKHIPKEEPTVGQGVVSTPSDKRITTRNDNVGKGGVDLNPYAGINGKGGKDTEDGLSHLNYKEKLRTDSGDAKMQERTNKGSPTTDVDPNKGKSYAEVTGKTQEQATETPTSEVETVEGTDVPVEAITPQIEQANAPIQLNMSLSSPIEIAKGVSTGQISQSAIQELAQTDPEKYQLVMIEKRKADVQNMINMGGDNMLQQIENIYAQQEQQIATMGGEEAVEVYNQFFKKDTYGDIITSKAMQIAEIDNQTRKLFETTVEETGNADLNYIQARMRDVNKANQDERSLLVAEMKALQSQQEIEFNQAQQQFAVYQQAEEQKRMLQDKVLQNQYNMTIAQYEMGVEQLNNQIKTLDAQKGEIVAQQQARAEAEKEEFDYQREIQLEEYRRQRDKSYEQQVAEMEFDEKVFFMEMDIEKQALILDMKAKLERESGKNRKEVKLDNNDIISYDPADPENTTVTIWSEGEQSNFSDIVSYSQTQRGRKNLQCGELVNDYLTKMTGETVRGGSKIGMDNSYNSKVSGLLNIGQVDLPVVGGIFVSEGNGEYGHTGIVTQVNPDGSIVVLEANAEGTAEGSEPVSSIITNTSGMLFSQSVLKDDQITDADIQSYNSPTFKPYDLSKEERDKFNRFVAEKREVMNDPDAQIEDVLFYSAGGSDLTDTPKKQIGQYKLTIDNLGEIDEQIGKQVKKGKNMGPIAGMFRGTNPRDIDAGLLEATITATVPTLARGVYGEVGVLTDQDVKLYKRTLPNIKQPEDLQKAVLSMSLKKVMNGYLSLMKTQAAAGVDVSLYVGDYLYIKRQFDSLINELPVGPEESINQSAANTYVSSGTVTTAGGEQVDVESFIAEE